MYQTQSKYIRKEMILSDLILENPSLLLTMQFFDINEAINNSSIEQVCSANNIRLELFLMIANLHHGFTPLKNEVFNAQIEVSQIIPFLRNAHHYYLTDKYPEIRRYIKELYLNARSHEIFQIEQIESFFSDYFKEVLEHLRYEDEIAFPYFCDLWKDDFPDTRNKFSVNDYRIHHSDIETKISDLKNLLIRHISFSSDFTLRRKIIKSLFELERDIHIHSMIEELILLPLVDEIEKVKAIG